MEGPQAAVELARLLRDAGYEADRDRISVVEVATKKTRVVTEAWDRAAGDLTWSADGKTITATQTGTNAQGQSVNNVIVLDKQ